MSNQKLENTYRCLFFGMPCTFSAPILAALRNSPIELVGVVTPAPRLSGKSFRVVSASPPMRPAPWPLAGMSSLMPQEPPRYLVRNMQDPELINTLVAQNVDLIVVACFPWLIPAPLVESARLAALNVHPSLLPRHGGPDPLFWTFQAGESETGVSVHHLTNRFDAGKVLIQARSPVHENEPLSALDHRLAVIGAELTKILLEALPDLPQPPLTNPALASYERKPNLDDLVIDRNWTVERARCFIAGVATSHGPLHYRMSGGKSLLIDRLGHDVDSVEIVLSNGTLRVQSAQ